MRKLALLVATTLLALPADAAVTPNSVVTPQTPNNARVQFLQGTDSFGTYKTLYTAGSNGSVCFGIETTNSEATQTHLVTIQEQISAVKYGGAVVTTVAGSGLVSGTPQEISGVPGVQGTWTSLPVDGNGNGYTQLVSGDTLVATYGTPNLATSGSVINVRAVCNDY
jgi:hypothetical protein